MGIIEILAGLLALVTAVAGALFKSRQNQAKLKAEAERKAEGLENVIKHDKNVRGALERSQQEGNEREKQVLDESRAGRRDHFDTDR